MVIQGIHPSQIKPAPSKVFLKIKKEEDGEMITRSGIYIAGVEQDYFIGEIVSVGSYAYDEKNGTKNIDLATGDRVLFEKNWHNVYDIENRNRIDHFIKILEDEDYNYYLGHYEDVLLKSNTDAKMYGELFSIINKKFTRIEL